MVIQRTRTVCLIEDDEAVRDSLRAWLESYDIRVRTYGSAHDFLADEDIAGELNKQAICLVFDVHLPGMTGIELLELLRARHVASPVIMITGRKDTLIGNRAAGAGALALFEKPLENNAFLHMLEQALSDPAVPAPTYIL